MCEKYGKLCEQAIFRPDSGEKRGKLPGISHPSPTWTPIPATL
uniref:Uncharacterized protein n=1 Tax=Faecalibaculum rodentium TaxID=1702221 RepID=A0A140DY99_9FIRM|nr:hypothetical protein AALO17_24920 [Faecalibaculum rodentium]